MNETYAERRSAIRIAPKGSIRLKLDDEIRHARIGNITQFGALAATDEPLEPSLVGRAIEIDVRLDGPHAEWITLRAHVVRAESSGVALTFETAPPAFADLMAACSRASNRHRRVLSVVLVDEHAGRRHAVAEGFRTIGCDVVDVATPLDAIFVLGETAFEPELIAIADSVARETSEQLRAFVQENHPEAKMIRIGEAGNAPEDVTHWLSAVPDELVARIRELLASPR